MSTLKNRVLLTGNVGQDPVLKTIDSGSKVVNLSIAVNERFKKKGDSEYTINTYWHNLVAWGNTAENINKVVKAGHNISIEGKLTSRKYEDKEGNNRYVTEVLLSDFEDHTYIALKQLESTK